MTGDAGSTTGNVIHWARAYDVLVWVHTLGGERRFRERLVDLARPGAGQAVLDVGSGTGTLAIAAKGRVGSSGQVCGVDPSPEMVARARRKAAKAGTDIRFDTAVIEALPFAEATFDIVLSTLVIHHLTDEGRRLGIGEIARVVKPGGVVLVVDLGGADNERRRLRLRVPNHAHFELDEVAPAFDRAGLHVTDRGPVSSRGMLGLSNLRFLRATAVGQPSPEDSPTG